MQYAQMFKGSKISERMYSMLRTAIVTTPTQILEELKRSYPPKKWSQILYSYLYSFDLFLGSIPSPIPQNKSTYVDVRTDGRLLKHDENKNYQAHTKVTRDKDTKYNFISFKKLYSNAYGDLEAITSFAKKAHVEYENAIYAVHDLCGKI